MQRLRFLSLVLAIPAVVILLTTVGCGGGDKSTDKPAGTGTGSPEAKKGSGTPKSGGAKEELASTGYGTIKGKVVFEGTPPTPKKLEFTKDTEHCKKGPEQDLVDPTWRVGSDKGVANVVVWLQAPANKYFKIRDDQKERGDTVTVHQPFCQFEPHVFVLYPSYFDPATKQQKRTGQKFRVINDATIPHNTNVQFEHTTMNIGDNRLLSQKSGNEVKELAFDVKPCQDKDCGKVEGINITCNIHPWMSAYGKAFDHPYVAVTSGGKEGDKVYGEYEIKNAPAGAEVELMFWHEATKKAEVAKKVTLKDGGTLEENITLKP